MENPVCSNPEDFFGNKYNTKSNNLIIIKVTQDNLICLTRNELKIILSLPTIEYSEDEEKIYNSKFWFYRLPQNDIWIDHTLKDAYDNRVNTMKIVSMSNLDGVGLHDPLTPYFQVKPISRKTLFEENNDEKYTIFSDSGNEDEIIEKNISKEETKKNLEWKSKSKLQLEMYDKPTQDWQKIARNKYNRKESLEIWKLGQNFMDFLHLQRMFLNNILFGTPDYGAYLYPDSQPFVNGLNKLLNYGIFSFNGQGNVAQHTRRIKDINYTTMSIPEDCENCFYQTRQRQWLKLFMPKTYIEKFIQTAQLEKKPWIVISDKMVYLSEKLPKKYREEFNLNIHVPTSMLRCHKELEQLTSQHWRVRTAIKFRHELDFPDSENFPEYFPGLDKLILENLANILIIDLDFNNNFKTNLADDILKIVESIALPEFVLTNKEIK